MPPDNRVHSGVCAVVWNRPPAGGGNKLLMVRRGGTKGYAADGHGQWAMPGGWLEFGEEPFDAAVREVMEETGISVRAVREDGYTCNIAENGSFQIVTLFVRCEYVSGEPTVTEPDKCPEVLWVHFTQFRAMNLFAPTRFWLDNAGWLDEEGML
jgi:8-oxo-dGTP diphosphatase